MMASGDVWRWCGRLQPRMRAGEIFSWSGVRAGAQSWLKTAAGLLMTVAFCAGAGAQVSFYTAVDQALRNSNQVRGAEADVRRAEGVIRELKDAYIPTLSVGSGLGYSYGFTITPPTLYNITSQSLIISFSQKDYIRSARAGMQAAQMRLKDVRQQVILDTAETYLELSALDESLGALGEERQYSERLTGILRERYQAGLESKVEVTRNRLTAATVALKQVQLENRRQELRDHLARMAGLPVDTFRTDAKSIPPAPAFAPGEPITGTVPAVEAASDNYRAKAYQATGAKHDEFRPQGALATQYNRYSTLTDYQKYFQRFEPNNFSFGLQLNWPLFDETRKARRMQADAEAERARSDYFFAKDQAGEQLLKLENSYREIAAQQEVAALTAELSQERLEAVLTQVNAAAAGQTPLTPKDEQTARIEERQRYLDALDAKLALEKIQLQLLRATGSIEAWAKSALETVPATAAAK